MSIRVENEAPGSPVHVIWGMIVFVIVILAGIVKPYMKALPGCTFHELFGIPCPTCGGTRSLAALSGFNFKSSFLFNPMVLISALALVIFSLAVLLGMILKKRIYISFSTIEKKIIRFTIIGIIVANWAFLIFSRKL